MFKKIEESLSKGVFERVNKILDRIRNMNCPRKDLVKDSIESLAKKEKDESLMAFYEALFMKGVLYIKSERRPPTNKSRLFVYIANKNLVDFSILYGMNVPSLDEVSVKYKKWYSSKLSKDNFSEEEKSLKKLSIRESLDTFLNKLEFSKFESIMIKIYEMKEEAQPEPQTKTTSKVEELSSETTSKVEELSQETKSKVEEKKEKKVIDKVKQESVKAPSDLGNDLETKGDKENSDNKSIETTDKSLTDNDNMNKKEDDEYIVLRLKKNDVKIALNVFESILETVKMSLK